MADKMADGGFSLMHIICLLVDIFHDATTQPFQLALDISKSTFWDSHY